MCMMRAAVSHPPRLPQVFSMRFSPEGDVIASGSHDKHIFLWRTYGECENYMMLKGALGGGGVVAGWLGCACSCCRVCCGVG